MWQPAPDPSGNGGTESGDDNTTILSAGRSEEETDDRTLAIGGRTTRESEEATLLSTAQPSEEADDRTIAHATPAPGGVKDDGDATRLTPNPHPEHTATHPRSSQAAPGWSTFLSPVDPSSGEIALNPGSVFAGRYKIIQRLGEGGMGAVYKAQDLELDRRVAIKVSRAERASNPEILQGFKQELILARQVTHRNVVRIFDLGVADNVKFISMEFIEGQELAGLLEEQGKLPPKQAADIMLQVCRGLEAAHTEGVVHRDLKPQNIMIDAQGRAAVMDFGIAHSMHSAVVTPEGTQADVGSATSALTVVGSILGPPRSMSPEQALNSQEDLTPKQYAWGPIPTPEIARPGVTKFV